MSKAFVKDDAETEALGDVDPADLVPEGAVNYLTTSTIAALGAELTALAEGAARDPEVDRRRRYLSRLLEISRPIDPATQVGPKIRFGATVTVLGADDRERTYVVVGIHETDARAGRISWNSPLGRALLGAETGDVVTLRRPEGEEELEILSVAYRPTV